MKKLVIALLVLAGLLVAADFGVAAAAEYQVSKKMREELRLADDPAVRINGFPFITQALAGDYRDVQVQVRGVPVGELRDVEVAATLYHVRAPLSDLLNGSVAKVTIDEVQGQVRIHASDIGRLIGIPDLQIEPAPEALEDPEEQDEQQDRPETLQAADETVAGVRLTGSTDVGGTLTEVTVVGVLALSGSEIQVTPRKLEINPGDGAVPLPESLQRSVLQTFTTRLDPGTLPFAVTPTAVRAEHGALVVQGRARNVSLSGGGA
ncbi:MAG TPA: LmeA family phospholipid-binding protein [Pseudonocardiaceae bacterium]